jgi:hypothetical protein
VIVTPRSDADALVAAIATLDARHDAHDATLSEPEYAATRAELKARLAEALAATGTPT